MMRRDRLGRYMGCAALLLVLLLFAGCSKPTTPTDVTKAALTAYRQGDLGKFERLVVSDLAEQIKPQNSLLKAQLAQAELVYGAEVIEGDLARVAVSMTHPDLMEIIRREEMPVDMRNPEIDPDWWPKLLAQIGDPAAPKKQSEMEAHLRKEQGEWRLVEMRSVR